MASARAINKTLSLALTLLVLFGLLRNYIITSFDPHRCGALLDRGTWLDPPTANGSRTSFNEWQPDGCMLHRYSGKDVQDCLESRHLLFVGDSTTRQVYWATARLLDDAKANELRESSGAHEDYDTDFGGVRLVFHWNPLLRLDGEHKQTARELEKYRHDKKSAKPVEDQEGPAAIFIGTGAWFAAEFDATKALAEFTQAYTQLADLVHNDEFLPPVIQEVDGADGIGSQLLIAPPVPPVYGDLNSRVANGTDIAPDEVLALQQWLIDHEVENGLPLLRSFPLLTEEQPATIEDLENTGFHVIDSVADVKANIILNTRCNAKLDTQNGYPYDRTCCTTYGSVPILQASLLGCCAVYLILCTMNELRTLKDLESSRSGIFNLDIGIFVTALLACFWADRTQALAKGSKAFSSWEFSAMCFLAAVVAAVTLARSLGPRPRQGQPDTSPTLSDTKPLSRDQTDEWKGWMQAIILIYHWTGGSRILGIYIGVRLLVAAYLFQTGFGHAVYFVSKKDFSFKRVASVLLRLNLLSCALPFVMRTEYMFYYFAPLVSFWFLVVYATFAIGSRFNDNPRALLAKFGVAAFICPGLVIWTPLLDWIFAFMSVVFRIEWDLHEWRFRLGLDGFIVYIGVFMGIVSVQTKLYDQILTKTKGTAGVLGAMSIALYWLGSSTYLGEKALYNQIHPFISFVPIFGFIALRNIHSSARVWYSRSMSWLGRCSLETFTLQFHLFLAADTKGLLLSGLFNDGGSLWLGRWRDFALIAPVFLWLSWRVAEATNAMVKLLITTTIPDKPSLAGAMDVESKGEGEASALPQWWHRAPSTGLPVKVISMLAVMWLMNLFH